MTDLLTYLLTYLLTPRSRVLLEKLTGFAPIQEIPRILWNNPKVHYRTHKCPPPVRILNLPMYITVHYFRLYGNTKTAYCLWLGYEPDGPRFESRRGGGIFLLSETVQTAPGAYPVSYSIGAGAPPGIKLLECDADHSPPTSANVKN